MGHDGGGKRDSKAIRRGGVELLPCPLRTLPADLAITAILVVLTDVVVLLPIFSQTPIRLVLGLPFVLFLPGYAFVAALFPERGDGPADTETTAREPPSRQSGIDGIERIALSFGLSIAVVPLIGLLLNFTPWGIRLIPVLIGVSAFTLGAVAIAAVRRQELPPDDRFRLPFHEWFEKGKTELLSPPTRTDAALNLLLAFSLIVALASIGYAVGVPRPGEEFTEFYLLTEDEDGRLIAADYPTEFSTGQSRPLVIGVSNHEQEQVSYTIIIRLQKVQFVDNRTVVTREAELDRLYANLDHNETRQWKYEVQPTITGERLRLQFLLFRSESVPRQPSVANAYRETHLWINVTSTG